jgi:hypothetical protein
MNGWENVYPAMFLSGLSVYIGFYVVGAIALFKIGKKANVRKPWVAFIPVLQTIVLLHIIDISGWAIFLTLIPVANIVLAIIWWVKLYLAFSVNAGLIVLSIIIPPAGLVMQLVIAFSDQFAYKGSNRFST